MREPVYLEITKHGTHLTQSHLNHRRVKKLRSYTIFEVSELMGIHKNTVHQWIRNGLETTDDKRPLLIRGCDLIGYLQTRRMRRRRPCGSGQLYCFRCRAAKDPAGAMADYIPLTEKLGNLTAICPDCGLIMHRVVSVANLEDIRTNLDITFPQGLARLSEIHDLSVNSVLGQEACT
jgi:hypothetical protein